MRKFSSREAKRMMDKLGLNAKEMPEVKEVIFRTSDRELFLKQPSVTVLEIQGQQVFQVVGEKLEERTASKPPEEAKPEIPEEDVLLVSQQANVSLEQAKAALEEADGDLAKAIILLTSKKS